MTRTRVGSRIVLAIVWCGLMAVPAYALDERELVASLEYQGKGRYASARRPTRD
jgi:hypothetical protein